MPERQVSALIRTRPKRLYGGEELVAALVVHPGFIPNRSVVSIGTGSSESFLPTTESETWAILKALAERGLRNPVWIVTKSGIPDRNLEQWLTRFEIATQCGIPIILSITYSAAPAWMEPYGGDRFRAASDLKCVGVRLGHHYRPIVRGINDTDECLVRALRASLGIAEVICVGGLRPDPGIRLVWEKIYQLDPELLPSGAAKDLPDCFCDRVRKILAKFGAGTPIVLRSSEAIATMLGNPDYNLYRYRAHDACFLHLPLPVQAAVVSTVRSDSATMIERTAQTIGLSDLDVYMAGECVMLSRTLSYQEHRLLLHALGFSGVFP